MKEKDSKRNIQSNNNIQITLLTAVIALTAILDLINSNNNFQKSLADLSFAEIPTIIIIFIMVGVIMYCMKDIFIFYFYKPKKTNN